MNKKEELKEWKEEYERYIDEKIKEEEDDNDEGVDDENEDIGE